MLSQRKSIRLKGYDYSQAGLYFITICTKNRLCVFGEIDNGIMKSNDAGIMIEQQWHEIENRFDKIKLHEFIIMPNHIHGIIESVGAFLVGARTDAGAQNVEHSSLTRQPQKGQSLDKGQPQGIAPTVGMVVGAFKSLSTHEYIRGVRNNGWLPFEKKLWQRNYYEHIIRDQKSYCHLSEYIQTNPLKWQDDTYYV